MNFQWVTWLKPRRKWELTYRVLSNINRLDFSNQLTQVRSPIQPQKPVLLHQVTADTIIPNTGADSPPPWIFPRFPQRPFARTYASWTRHYETIQVIIQTNQGANDSVSSIITWASSLVLLRRHLALCFVSPQALAPIPWPLFLCCCCCFNYTSSCK